MENNNTPAPQTVSMLKSAFNAAASDLKTNKVSKTLRAGSWTVIGGGLAAIFAGSAVFAVSIAPIAVGAVVGVFGFSALKAAHKAYKAAPPPA